MGIAAYNRGTSAVRIAIASQFDRPPEFVMMDQLNNIPRVGKPTPFGPVHFVYANEGWWAECPKTGFGYWFRTLALAVGAFNVAVTEYDNGVWKALPRARS